MPPSEVASSEARNITARAISSVVLIRLLGLFAAACCGVILKKASDSRSCGVSTASGEIETARMFLSAFSSAAALVGAIMPFGFKQLRYVHNGRIWKDDTVFEFNIRR
jgi:hypothetical protein